MKWFILSYAMITENHGPHPWTTDSPNIQSLPFIGSSILCNTPWPICQSVQFLCEVGLPPLDAPDQPKKFHMVLFIVWTQYLWELQAGMLWRRWLKSLWQDLISFHAENIAVHHLMITITPYISIDTRMWTLNPQKTMLLIHTPKKESILNPLKDEIL